MRLPPDKEELQRLKESKAISSRTLVLFWLVFAAFVAILIWSKFWDWQIWQILELK